MIYIRPLNRRVQVWLMKYGYLFLLPFFLLAPSCKKLVEIDPPKTDLITETVFSQDITATSALLSVYAQMIGNFGPFSGSGFGSINTLAGLSSDEYVNYMVYPERMEFYQNSLTATNLEVQSYLWDPIYNFIYQANAILKGVEDSKTLTFSTKQQLTGEAKFIRAFCYFYLVNIFGDVPLVTSTDYVVNSTLPRAQKSEIYSQIIIDLKDAQSSLNEQYVNSDNTTATVDRIRPNRFAAAALLARVYLFSEDWINAESTASMVINKNDIYDTVELTQVFLRNSKEVIWQLEPSLSPYGYETIEGSIFILTSKPRFVSLPESFVNSFESGDKRKILWMGSYTEGTDTYYYPFKYKIQYGDGTKEASTVLRLAELYLIRAEARAQLGNIAGSQEDINVIRERAGLLNTTASTKSELITAIENQRRLELFSEWGHRWFDIKRWKGFANNSITRADEIMPVVTAAKGGTWNPNWKLYPIPQGELDKNPNLKGSQNPGY